MNQHGKVDRNKIGRSSWGLSIEHTCWEWDPRNSQILSKSSKQTGQVLALRGPSREEITALHYTKPKDYSIEMGYKWYLCPSHMAGHSAYSPELEWKDTQTKQTNIQTNKQICIT